MQALPQSGNRAVRTWWFWAFVLLAVPNCILNSQGTCTEEPCGPCDPGDPECEQPPPKDNFEPGDPATDAIMCAIPVPVADPTDNCASALEAADATNVTTAQAATALASGASSDFGLDFSDEARQKCGGVKPMKVVYMGDGAVYPDGLHLCINCGQKIPNPFATAADACIAKCKDLINKSNGFKPMDVDAYCSANATTATNYGKKECDVRFHDSCTGVDMPTPGFFDPRRHPDPINWTDTVGLIDTGVSLSRTTAASGQNLTDWTEGAASTEIILTGDAWIDFSSSTTDGAHAIGVRESRTAVGDQPCEFAQDCPDGVTSLDDIGFAIDLNHLAEVYVIETSPSFITPGPFGNNYTVGERFRIHITDNNDQAHTATISYSRINGPCDDGSPCDEPPFRTSPVHPRYPLRVDTSFRDPSGFVSINIVRIKP